MKKNLLLLFLMLCPIMLTSCVDDDNFDEAEAIIGNWVGADSQMGCEFDSQGAVNPNIDRDNIDQILLEKGWIFEGDTYVDYMIDTYNQIITLKVTNTESGTNTIINQDYIDLQYYFYDYNHINIAGYDFERY